MSAVGGADPRVDRLLEAKRSELEQLAADLERLAPQLLRLRRGEVEARRDRLDHVAVALAAVEHGEHLDHVGGDLERRMGSLVEVDRGPDDDRPRSLRLERELEP